MTDRLPAPGALAQVSRGGRGFIIDAECPACHTRRVFEIRDHVNQLRVEAGWWCHDVWPAQEIRLRFELEKPFPQTVPVRIVLQPEGRNGLRNPATD